MSIVSTRETALENVSPNVDNALSKRPTAICAIPVPVAIPAMLETMLPHAPELELAALKKVSTKPLTPFFELSVLLSIAFSTSSAVDFPFFLRPSKLCFASVVSTSAFISIRVKPLAWWANQAAEKAPSDGLYFVFTSRRWA